jgi:hypothetical protein
MQLSLVLTSTVCCARSYDVVQWVKGTRRDDVTNKTSENRPDVLKVAKKLREQGGQKSSVFH